MPAKTTTVCRSSPSGCSVFHRSLFAVTLIEAIHASRSVNQLLFAGEKGMASGADFNMQVALFSGARGKSLAAGAGNSDLAIFRMNLWFHYLLNPRYRPLKFPIFQTNYDRV